ncbi:unnamed protein product [Symbiodinium natans]|uniref:Uncharacterized protein n=1 Tax=Symbiodinium natans TaxID=878477 RepID=A0A812G957_9DINO|nr:unnamed protein product [Symbiodinium natans]
MSSTTSTGTSCDLHKFDVHHELRNFHKQLVSDGSSDQHIQHIHDLIATSRGRCWLQPWLLAVVSQRSSFVESTAKGEGEEPPPDHVSPSPMRRKMGEDTSARSRRNMAHIQKNTQKKRSWTFDQVRVRA